VSASVPQSVAIHQDPKGSGRGCSLGRGSGAHCKLALPGLRVHFHKPGISAKKGVTFSIRLDALGPADGVERGGELFKAIARQVIKSDGSANKKRAIGSFTKCHARVRWNSPRCSEWLKALAVKSKDAVFGADPKKADAVLIDSADGEILQAFRTAEGAKARFLSTEYLTRQRQQGKRERNDSTPHTRI